MAFRYLIYATGTTYNGTIVRESAVNNPGVNEASFYTDFIIPEIQPLYLWRVDNINTPTDVIPNTESNINNYEAATGPAPQPNDLATLGEVTGYTSTKIDKVSGQTNKLAVFTAGGDVQSGGYTIPQLTGLTTYTFSPSGGTQISQVGNHITIYTTAPTGSTVYWGNILGNIQLQTDLQNEFNTKLNISTFSGFTGTTLPANYYNKTQINSYTGETDSILTGLANDIDYISGQTDLKLATSVFNAYTGSTQPILNKAITGVTNLGTGSTLGGTSARNITLKSISVRGGLGISNDGNNVIISGATNLPTTWGEIDGTLSNQTDLWNTLTGMTAQINTKLATSVFNSFTGTTLPANYYNKTQINSYTGATNTLIGTKVNRVTGATQNDIVIFGVGGQVADSGKLFTTTVQSVGLATNNNVPTELAVRNAINQAVSAAVILQGDWNATANTPDLQVTGITTGFAWRVSVSGTTNLGGLNYWLVGDLAIKSASGWIRVISSDIAAIWGNITGTLSNQTDLQNALNAKTNVSLFNSYTGTTAPATYLTKSAFNTYSGTTVPANYYNKSQINSYTAQTQTQINSKLNTSVFTGYTASTKNKDKKIQVVSTLTSNANVVTPLEITWASANPYATDMYLWSGGSAVWIKSAGTYEVQYHVLLKNDNANQTHSVGGYILKNGVTVQLTATAGMIVGSNASGELSLPPVVLTLALNDRLDLAVFRIGSAGNANLVNGSVFLTLNKLT